MAGSNQSFSKKRSYGVSFRIRDVLKRGLSRVGTFLVPLIVIYVVEGGIVLVMWETFRSAQGWIIQKTIFSEREADLPEFLSDSFIAPQLADIEIINLAIVGAVAFLVMLLVQLVILSQTFGMGVSLLSDNISFGRRMFLSRWALLEIIGGVLTQIAVLLRTAVWLFLAGAAIVGGVFYFAGDFSTFLPLLLGALSVILLMIRALFVWFTQSFAAPIIVYEQRDFFSARTESKQFTDGEYHKILMLWLTVMAIGVLLFAIGEYLIEIYELATIQGGALVVLIRYLLVHLMLVTGASFMGAAYKQANEVNLPYTPLALPSGK